MMIVLRKSIFRPNESVIFPSSKIWSKQMHHVGMRFFDFVEEHDRVGPAPDGFGKLPAFLVTDVARRRADQARGGEFFHVLRHVDLDERVGIAKHELGQGASEEGFADAGRAEKDERADRAFRILQVGARTAERLADRADRFILADDALL